MRITKFGHSCILLEIKGLRVLFDPGGYTTEQNYVKGLDVILITHKHPDHLNLNSLNKMIKNNPKVTVITNSDVGKVLDGEGIKYDILENHQNKNYKNVLIEGFGTQHKKVYGNIPAVINIGYLVDNSFFNPGDALPYPERKVNVLALPVCGPWMKTREVIDYALRINPKYCFPVHDGMLNTFGGFHKWPKEILNNRGIKFVDLELEKEMEF